MSTDEYTDHIKLNCFCSKYTDILNEEENTSSDKEEFNSGDEITSHYNRNHK
ncbi:1073_t:CDS:2 [Entrophospora sp. SA101]|nr:1073_t:CDS:2 [Entrophospora sp. SA101]